MNVLIVDDDQTMALLAAALLRSVAKDVEIVGTLAGLWAAMIAAPSHFHVVLLDLQLPDSNPSQTLAAIRSIKTKIARVVVMTGAYLPDVEEVVTAAGADACFYKGNADFVSWLKTKLN